MLWFDTLTKFECNDIINERRSAISIFILERNLARDMCSIMALRDQSRNHIVAVKIPIGMIYPTDILSWVKYPPVSFVS